MNISNRDKKRILIFLIIPVLTLIPIFTDDITLKIVASVVLVIYVGFIIFLRDSLRIRGIFNNDSEVYISSDEEFADSPYDTDAGEEFKIISGPANSEVLTADKLNPKINTGKRTSIKPANLKENFEKIAFEKVPEGVNQDEQFVFVLEKILNVIKESFLAHSALFFWYNEKKQKLALEKYISDSDDILKDKFDIEDDILSKIVLKEEPELLTDITPNAEADVIRYYELPQGIKSFVGVPLFYGKHLTGVLALDSKANDTFGIETIYNLGRFVRVLAIIISLFEERYVDTTSQDRLKALLNVINANKKFENENELFENIYSAVTNLITWDVFTFIYFDPNLQKFKILKTINKTPLKYVGENLEINLKGTIVGKAIMSGIPVRIEDTAEKEIIRFADSEDVKFEGSFLAVPLVYDEQNYGVLCFESLKKNIYSNSDIKFIRSAAKLFSFIVYSYSTNSILMNLLSLDIETKALNYNSFMERMSSDLIKSKELDVPSAVALIQIDEFLDEGSLFEEDPFPKVLMSITNIIRNEITLTNLFGRLSDKIFAVFFFNKNTKDVFLWAEKLRIKIARKPVEVLTKQTTFTVSIGVASAKNKTEFEEVMKNAELALNKAIEKGGNSVKSI